MEWIGLKFTKMLPKLDFITFLLFTASFRWNIFALDLGKLSS